MKNLSKVILFLTLQCNIILADTCPNPVTALQQGQVAPCTGYLFTPVMEASARKMKRDYTLLNEQVTLQTKELDLWKNQVTVYQQIAEDQKKETDLWRKSATDSAKEIVDLKSEQRLKDWLLVSVGFIAAALAAFAGAQLRK